MKPKVGIGITTYVPIFDPAFGELVFNAYAAASSRLSPYQIAVWSLKHPISSGTEFAAHWATSGSFELLTRRGGDVLERGFFNVGAEWRTKGPLSGGGRVYFASNKDPRGSHELVLEHNFSAGVDWVTLFRSLVTGFAPSHAMLHVFTDRERNREHGDGSYVFNRPMTGEGLFTSSLLPSGVRRRPDSFRVEERRRYCSLPELAWANVFGKEFAGQYDAEKLRTEAARFETTSDAAYLQITDHLEDVIRAPELFEQARARLKASFADQMFFNP